jgi:oxygen-independent coproporphyrinogen-3 oxidase
VKDKNTTKFVYTDRLWQGADMVGLGVASFGHMSGVHMQNLDTWETYAPAVREGTIPLSRAYRPTDDERLIREVVLQLKRGSIVPGYFREKYGVDIDTRFKTQFDSLAEEGYIAAHTAQILSLTRDGLLRVDGLLKRFFLPQHLKVRYT